MDFKIYEYTNNWRYTKTRKMGELSDGNVNIIKFKHLINILCFFLSF